MYNFRPLTIQHKEDIKKLVALNIDIKYVNLESIYTDFEYRLQIFCNDTIAIEAFQYENDMDFRSIELYTHIRSLVKILYLNCETIGYDKYTDYETRFRLTTWLKKIYFI